MASFTAKRFPNIVIVISIINIILSVINAALRLKKRRLKCSYCEDSKLKSRSRAIQVGGFIWRSLIGHVAY